jgi:RHS repeat-associated protein
MIWSGDTKNTRDQWTNFSMGNGLKTVWTYDANSRKNSIQIGTISLPTSIQNLGFTFNDKGQLTNRTDGVLSESFVYDNLDRLTQASVGSEVQQFSYLPNGNINNTTLAGTYKYLANQQHAVSDVEGVSSTGQAPSLTTTSTFTSDNKIAAIDNGTYKDMFSYGPDGNRFKVDYYQAGSLKTSKIYIDNNEFVYNSTGQYLCGRTFIFAPTGICAVYQDTVKNGANLKEIYYIHADYLGSWLAITNSAGSLTNKYSYDAWGRLRNPATWELLPISITDALVNLNAMQPRFDRGYTGHEIMAGFGLINMNGRLYDPYLQRFLSPDNEVQDPLNTQNFNRYTYCLNNPLRYTDPSGYEWDPWDASMDADIYDDPFSMYQFYSDDLNDYAKNEFGNGAYGYLSMNISPDGTFTFKYVIYRGGFFY